MKHSLFRRTRIRRAFKKEAAKEEGVLDTYFLVLRHNCPREGKEFQCLCLGTRILVFDGELNGQARIYGRYYVTCSAHGTRTHYGHRRAARYHAKRATFCRMCQLTFLRHSPCHMCGAPERHCAMCDP